MAYNKNREATKKTEHERIIASRTTLEDLQIRMLVGLSFAFWVIILPPFYFIVWTMEGGWESATRILCLFWLPLGLRLVKNGVFR